MVKDVRKLSLLPRQSKWEKRLPFLCLPLFQDLAVLQTPFLERHKHLLTPGMTATEYDSTRVQLVPISLLAILTEYGERVTYRRVKDSKTATSPHSLTPSQKTGILSVDNIPLPSTLRSTKQLLGTRKCKGWNLM